MWWFIKEDGEVSFGHPEFKMLLYHLGGAHSGNAGLEFMQNSKEVEGVENKGIGIRCLDSLAPLLTRAFLSLNISLAKGTTKETPGTKQDEFNCRL